jgi:hypothetical protein
MKLKKKTKNYPRRKENQVLKKYQVTVVSGCYTTVIIARKKI